MPLDVRTLLAATLVASATMAAILWLGSAGRLRDGLGRWTAALLAQALACALLAGRGVMPDLLSIAVANAALVLSWSLQAAAIFEFQRRRFPRAVYWVPALGMLAFFAATPEQSQIRLVFAGFAYATGETLLAIIVLARAGGAGIRMRALLSATYALIAALNLARGVQALIHPQSLEPLLAGGGSLQSVTFVAAFAAVIVASFAFLTMHVERAEEAIRRLATIDPLTGVYNRRTFIDLAQRELARGRRRNLPVSLVILDLDLFKRVNDTHGHPVGDKVLVAFAQLVQRCLRREDLMVRYGGEEFCLVLPGTDLEEAERLAERVRTLVAATPIAIDGGHVDITVSCGVATVAPDRDIDLDAALGVADRALYRAKEGGRNRTCAAAA